MLRKEALNDGKFRHCVGLIKIPAKFIDVKTSTEKVISVLQNDIVTHLFRRVNFITYNSNPKLNG